MALFPLDEETKRRLALTSGFNPNLPDVALPRRPLSAPGLPEGPTRMPGLPTPSPLPETAMPRSIALPTRTPPTGGMPPIKQPTRAEEVGEARDVYLQGTPGRFKSGLLGALQGGLRGLAGGGGLGAALGGAVGGGAFGAINPRGQREMEFEQTVKPKLAERFALEDQDRAQRMAAAKAAGDQAMQQIQIANLGSQIESRGIADRLAQDKAGREVNQPMILNPGQVAVNRRTGQKEFEVPAAPKPPTQAELSIEPTSGKSFEEIAEESYQGRGGDQYVLSKLPERTRQLLSGQVRDAAPQEIEAANRAFREAVERERKSISDYTRGSVRGRALGTRKGGSAVRKGQPGRRFISVAEGDDLLK